MVLRLSSGNIWVSPIFGYSERVFRSKSIQDDMRVITQKMAHMDAIYPWMFHSFYFCCHKKIMLAFSYSLVVADFFFLRAFVLILSQKLYKYTFLYDFVSNAFFFYLVPINRRFSTLVEISFSQSNGSFIGLKYYFFSMTCMSKARAVTWRLAVCLSIILWPAVLLPMHNDLAALEK